VSAPARPGSLLAVFAHPDDESIACGGTLAWCARLGTRVALLCATRGEHGAISPTYVEADLQQSPPPQAGLPPKSGPRALAQVRTHELAAATRLLGVDDLLWLDHEDGMLPWIDPARLEADIAGVIRHVRPDVVLTFDADGLYWHPDHVALHERTTAAVASLERDAPALYYVTIPRRTMRAVADLDATRGASGPGPRILGLTDVDAFGADAPAPSLVLDVAPFAACKLAALKCHRSQVAGDALDRLTDDDARRLLATEQFRRAPVGARGDTLLDRLTHARIPA
jgi:LmbE family N-acetylglucosaminyl deacetylase